MLNNSENFLDSHIGRNIAPSPILMFSSSIPNNLSPETLLTKAREHLDRHQPLQALSYLDKLIHQDPSCIDYHYLRGKTLAKLKRRAEALIEFNKVINQQPNFSQAWVERAYTRENLSDIQGAVDDYTQALQGEPAHYFALYRRGILRMKLGQMQAANADFLASLDIKDNDPAFYCSRGEQYLLLGKYPEAISDFSEALRLKPNCQELIALKQEAEHLRAHPELAAKGDTKPTKSCIIL